MQYTKKDILKALKRYQGRRIPNTHNFKKMMIREGVLPNKCAECGLEDSWNGKFLSFHLDHTDGDATNNALSNLRLLCPNCHSQTDTYCGKNAERRYKKKECERCGGPVSATWVRLCSSCFVQPSKIDWPSDDDFLKLLQDKDYNVSEVGRFLGVSDNGVRKHAKKRGIAIPRKYRTARN